MSKFIFGDIIIVNQDEIGLVIETWENEPLGRKYVKIWNKDEEDVEVWDEDLVSRYDFIRERAI